MNRMPCRAPGCTSLTPSRGYGIYCNKHRIANKTHGHPLQVPLKVPELEAYRRTVRAIRARNEASPAWGMLDARWQVVIDHATQVLGLRDAGQAHNTYEVKAAESIRDLAGVVKPQRVVDAALSVYLLHRFQPRRFRDERAFNFALVRLVRRLAPLASGSYWNPKLQRVSKVYRNPPPRAVEILASWLTQAFAVPAVLIGDMEENRPNQAAEEKRLLKEAITQLQ